MGLFCLFFWFCRRFLENQTNIRENQKYQRKPTTTKLIFGKTKQPKFLKVSDPPLDMGLVLFVFLVFPKVFTKPTNPSRKPKIQKKTKENQTNIRNNQKNKVFKGFRPTLGYVFCFLFLFFWFPEGFYKTKTT